MAMLSRPRRVQSLVTRQSAPVTAELVKAGQSTGQNALENGRCSDI